MGGQRIQADAAVLRRALGKGAAHHARAYAEAMAEKGNPKEAARWRQIADALRDDTLIEA